MGMRRHAKVEEKRQVLLASREKKLRDQAKVRAKRLGATVIKYT